ncbi:MAG: MBL fold metallo-hydrolase [Chloroflexi bacterium]|nr:MBL fold metallo-hydrolase [Chloroflexota bacterium]
MTVPWREIADRVWIRRYESLDQTIGVIGGEAGLAVIDTRATHRLADELRNEVRALPGTLAAVVNTHGHWDHAFGNARFFDVPIWGHVRCAAMLRERGEAMRVECMERYPTNADDFRAVEITAPTDLFEDRATLELGDRRVELQFLGRGHTDNDIVVTVPGASVLFAGDLLENAPSPWFGDGYPQEWAITGQALLSLVDGVVVPGHGEPFGRDFAERQVADIGELARLGVEVAAGRLGADAAVRLSPFPADETLEAFERVRLEAVDGRAERD